MNHFYALIINIISKVFFLLLLMHLNFSNDFRHISHSNLDILFPYFQNNYTKDNRYYGRFPRIITMNKNWEVMDKDHLKLAFNPNFTNSELITEMYIKYDSEKKDTIKIKSIRVDEGDYLYRLALNVGVTYEDITDLLYNSHISSYNFDISIDSLLHFVFEGDAMVGLLIFDKSIQYKSFFRETSGAFNFKVVPHPIVHNYFFISLKYCNFSDQFNATGAAREIIQKKVSYLLDSYISRYQSTFEEPFYCNIFIDVSIQGIQRRSVTVHYFQLTSEHGIYNLLHVNKRDTYNLVDINGMPVIQAFDRHPLLQPSISSTFDLSRTHPILGYTRPHFGTDYSHNINTPVYSVSDGIVKYFGYQRDLGNHIVIKHGFGYESVYAHLNAFSENLFVGAMVNMNVEIGKVGKTGLASGYHLHYELKIDGQAVDNLLVRLPSHSIIGISEQDVMHFKKFAQLITQFNSVK